MKSRSGHSRPVQSPPYGPAPIPPAQGMSDGQGIGQGVVESSHEGEVDVPMTPGTPRTAGRDGEEDIAEVAEAAEGTMVEDSEPEWITWRFSDEEEARRRAYLPLA